MYKKVLLIVLTAVLICCSKYENTKPKRAIVDTMTINKKTGVTIYSGWKEVRVLEEKDNLAKVQWLDGSDIKWVQTDTGFKYLE